MTPLPQRNARGRALQVMLAIAAIALFTGFMALGTWQVERRTWKLALIERVNSRVHAPPAPLPAEAAWPDINVAADEYRHVQLTGHYLPVQDTLVQAVTVQGSGFWVMSPLQQGDGSVVLVNRGFVPTASNQAALTESKGSGAVTVTGLLRLTEPGGGFLRTNDPAANRWFSRDVAAITARLGLKRVAPFFVDAEAAPNQAPGAAGQPVAGLTVIAFHNSHLVYAITWYALALMVAGGAGVWAVHNGKRHKTHDDERLPVPP